MFQPWLSEALPTLNDLISHLNRASDLTGRGSSVERADAFFRALNKLWNVLGLRRVEGGSSDTILFSTLLAEAISTEDQRELLDSPVVAQLAALDPAILNEIVAGLRGEWESCTIRGRISERAGGSSGTGGLRQAARVARSSRGLARSRPLRGSGVLPAPAPSYTLETRRR